MLNRTQFTLLGGAVLIAAVVWLRPAPVITSSMAVLEQTQPPIRTPRQASRPASRRQPHKLPADRVQIR